MPLLLPTTLPTSISPESVASNFNIVSFKAFNSNVVAFNSNVVAFNSNVVAFNSNIVAFLASDSNFLFFSE
jgi:hypothetical protein